MLNNFRVICPGSRFVSNFPNPIFLCIIAFSIIQELGHKFRVLVIH